MFIQMQYLEGQLAGKDKMMASGPIRVPSKILAPDLRARDAVSWNNLHCRPLWPWREHSFSDLNEMAE